MTSTIRLRVRLRIHPASTIAVDHARHITRRLDDAMTTSLVTGGAGFLGSHLCEALLKRGDHVICVDNLETGSLANIEHLGDDAGRVSGFLDVVGSMFGIFIDLLGRLDFLGLLGFFISASPQRRVRM